jgi:hypothetical protein
MRKKQRESGVDSGVPSGAIERASRKKQRGPRGVILG